ncbi:MAG: aldo/keto reductase, partial [Pseudomonadota bacterium]
WVVATKLGNAYRHAGAPPNTGGLSRRWIFAASEASLNRLGLDHVDLLYVHRTDPIADLDETIAAFGDLIRLGRIRYWALSNVRAWQIADIVHRCRALGVPQPIALQPYYNLMNRQPEVEVIPAARHFGLGIATYSPLARGILSGKYSASAAPPDGTRAARGDKRLMEAEWRPESLAIAERLKQHCAAAGTTLPHFATRWVLNNDAVTSVIAGPRTFEQWQSYLGYWARAWSAADEAMADDLVPVGHSSAHGASDPSYPIKGRFPIVPAGT